MDKTSPKERQYLNMGFIERKPQTLNKIFSVH